MGSFAHVFARLAARDLFRRQDGQTMAEYAVILAVISGAVILALMLLTGNIQHVIERIADAIS